MKTIISKGYSHFTLLSNFQLTLLLLSIKLVDSFTLDDHHKAESIVIHQPSSGSATLIPGTDLHLQCNQMGVKNPNFVWYWKSLDDPILEKPILPGDDYYQIINNKLIILKPNRSHAGDYICVLLDENKDPIHKESQTIKVRTRPYIDEFRNLPLSSHTGASVTLNDGDRLELLCNVTDRSAKVNVTWSTSPTPDREQIFIIDGQQEMQPDSIETKPDQHHSTPPQSNSYIYNPHLQTFDASQDQSSNSIIIETIDNFSKRLIIKSIKPEHRSYYFCIANNGIIESTPRGIFVRVKDNYVALWPFLGIIAELFILFTIIYIWETQRAYKDIHHQPTTTATATGGGQQHQSRAVVGGVNKRAPSGGSVPFENVPLTSGS